MTRSSTTSAAFFLVLGIAFLCAPAPTHAQRRPRAPPECRTGGVCCTECNKKCYGYTIACKSNCIAPPCIRGDKCEAIADEVAGGVHSSACYRAKQFCGVKGLARATAIRSQKVSLETCCKVVIGGCQGTAGKMRCETHDYGNCTPEQLQYKYQELVSQECKDSVCNDFYCKDVLAHDSRCAAKPPPINPTPPDECSSIEYCWDQVGIPNCGWCYSPRHPNGGYGVSCKFVNGRCITNKCSRRRFLWNDRRLAYYGRKCSRRP